MFFSAFKGADDNTNKTILDPDLAAFKTYKKNSLANCFFPLVKLYPLLVP